MSTVHIGNDCLLHAHSDPDQLVRDAQRTLHGVSYDTVVGTGISGSLVLPVLALGLRKNKLLVRKPGDRHRHHDSVMAEGDLGDSWVFVDDGMVTGETFQHVKHQVEQLARQHRKFTQFAGAYLYGHGAYDPPQFLSPGHRYLQEEVRPYAGAFAV